MPVLTDYQKQTALQQAGYDTSKFTLDDNGFVTPLVNRQPTISADSNIPNKPSPTPQSSSPSYSPLATAGMSLAQSAPSAIGGGLGAAGGLAAASWLLGPEAGIPASLLAMLGGGMLGSGAARGIQNAIEPQAATQAVQEAQQENPKSAVLGELASIPLGGFNPSPSGVLEGLGAGAKVLTGMKATAPEMAALRNLAFNAGLGAAQPSINYALGQGPAPTLSGTLQGAGIGALFNKPNAIGNALGFGELTLPSQVPDKDALLQVLLAKQQSTQQPVAQDNQVATLTPEQLVSAGGIPTTRGLFNGNAYTLPKKSDKMYNYKATPEPPDVGTFENEGGTVAPAEESPEETKLAQEFQTRVQDFKLAKQELVNSELEKNVAQINQQIANNRLQADQANKPTSAYETGTGEEKYPDYTGVTEQDNTEAEQESEDDLQARQEEARLAGEEQPKYQEKSAFPAKTVPANHLSVKEAIDSAQQRTDDASILPEDANELHSILSKQVDWSTMPKVGEMLRDKSFDPLDPDLWVKVQDEYNKYLNAPKAQQTPKNDIVPPASPTKAEAPISQPKASVVRAKNPALTGEKALADFKGNLPKPIGATDLQPKPEERISPNSSEGLRQIWSDIDAGNGRAAMNRIEYAYGDANPDTKQVLHAQMYVLKKKLGIEPSDQFKINNPKYQEEPEFKIGQKLDEQGISVNNVKEWNDVISKWAKPRFGIEIDNDGNITNSSTGKPVAGQAYLRNALREAFIKINPDKAGIDTLPHELHHVFMDYLEHYGSNSDKKFMDRAYQKVSETPEFQKAKQDNPSLDPNEFLASRGGLEFINRQLGLEGNNRWKQFWKDYISHLKDKFTKTATAEDYTRLLNYKMLYDPMYKGSRFNGTGTAQVPQEQEAKNQGEPKINNLETDINRFREIHDRMSELMRQGSFSGDEFHNLWKEMEEIKNKHGGMPPVGKGERNQDNPQINTDKFKRWFGKSKVIDDDGKPLVVYHESGNKDINVFNENSHFGTSEQANNHLNKVGSNRGDMNRVIYPTYLRIENPMIGKDYGQSSWHNQIETAKELGHDGIVYENSQEGKGKSWIAFNPEQIKSATGNNGRFNRGSTDIRNQDFSQFAPTKAYLDKAQTKAEEQGHAKEGEDFSKAIKTIIPLKDQTQAKYFEPIRKASEGMKQDSINKVDDTLLKEFRTKQDLSGTLSGKERTLYDAIRNSYNTKQQDQIAANQPVTDYNAQGKPFLRLPQIDPFYHVNKISPKVADTLVSGTAAEKAKLESDFMNHQAANGISTKAATEKLQAIKDAYDTGKPNLASFAANRKAEGIGLPDSWMRKGDLLKNLNNYYSRVATDRAYYDTIETNPDVATSLGIKNDPWGKPYTSQANDISSIPEVRDIMDKITGEPFHKDEAVLKSLNRVASSMMLGPLTNIHIAAGSAANSINYIHPGELAPAFGHAVKNLANNWEKVYETGYHKKDFSGIKDLVNTNLTALEKMNSLSSSIANLSGRQGMNHFTKAFLQGVGEYVVKNRAMQANTGDAGAIRFMKEFDPEWQQGKVYTGKTLDNLGSTFASYIHGAHDVRTLPGWMLKDTVVQPFFSLASWNIAQTNAWMKHVWTPAKEGNFTPLIMSTLGSVVGGYIVKQMREGIADKKSPIPSLTELVKSDRGLEGNIPLAAYNLMTMASYTGFAGILSTAAKAGQDIAFKNIPQGAAFPLDELISNPAHRISQFLSAMYNDPTFDFTKAGPKFVTDLVRENFQLGRVIENWTADKTDILGENAHYEKNVSDALGDLRRFKMVEGMPYDDQEESEANPYMERTLKEFKRTQDVGEAEEDLPDLIQGAFTRANGNVDVLRQQLNKIKQNNYETMPSPYKIPRTFITYLNYLSETQGEDVASKRLNDYLMQEGVNRVKASMVPKI